MPVTGCTIYMGKDAGQDPAHLDRTEPVSRSRHQGRMAGRTNAEQMILDEGYGAAIRASGWPISVTR
jgi:hypothetical protein